jgi:uncharacterized protein
MTAACSLLFAIYPSTFSRELKQYIYCMTKMKYQLQIHASRRVFKRDLRPINALYLFDRRNPFSSWQGHGTDLLGDSLAHNSGVPKIILHGYSETGFDIVNMVKNKDPTDDKLRATGGIVHCTGSVLVFPDSCYLWKVRKPRNLTVESLAPAILYRPALEYLFLGSAEPIPPSVVQAIRDGLNQQATAASGGSSRYKSIVVEPMDLTNALGTFNILNGEDRRVGAALILPPIEDENNE